MYDILLQVFTDNEERPGEKRIYSMAFDSKHDRLLTGKYKIDNIYIGHTCLTSVILTRICTDAQICTDKNDVAFRFFLFLKGD